jgi:hypothetical protein
MKFDYYYYYYYYYYCSEEFEAEEGSQAAQSM